MADRIARIDRFCQESVRNRSELDVAVALRNPDPSDRHRLASLGVDELVLVESPPEDVIDLVPLDQRTRSQSTQRLLNGATSPR
ncbi:hypothetical protein [Gordonia sp. HS-NH1]|uniref:hypothetical protein n=1 Tax=Gordonia sp. HS-NH1 TaxID=1435068 RepID=UPI0006E20DCC|nr:hypothetical protein [Gordonia sp. HS-NH1]